MKKKILSILLAGALVCALGACAGKTDQKQKESNGNKNTEKSNSPKEISIAESGYSIVDNGFGSIYVYYGVSINNPNEKISAKSPNINITAKGEDGSVITTFDQGLFYIAPNDTASFGGVIDCNGKTPASIDITATCKNYVPAPKNTIHTSSLVVSNPAELTTDLGTTYTGEVENTSKYDLNDVAVTVILKNNGSIVFGYTTFVSNLAKGSKQAFEIQPFQKAPEHTEYVITAQSWNP